MNKRVKVVVDVYRNFLKVKVPEMGGLGREYTLIMDNFQNALKPA